jgi:hypothetical protein
MKAWMLDIKNEAQNMTFTDEDQLDWWNALFAEVQTIEPKNNAPRRDGLMGDGDNGISFLFPLQFRLMKFDFLDDGPTAKKDSIDKPGEINPSSSSVAPLFVQVPAQDFKGYTENEGFSDDDSDDDVTPKSAQKAGDQSSEKRKSQANAVVSNPNALGKYSKKIKTVLFSSFSAF